MFKTLRSSALTAVLSAVAISALIAVPGAALAQRGGDHGGGGEHGGGGSGGFSSRGSGDHDSGSRGGGSYRSSGSYRSGGSYRGSSSSSRSYSQSTQRDYSRSYSGSTGGRTYTQERSGTGDRAGFGSAPRWNYIPRNSSAGVRTQGEGYRSNFYDRGSRYQGVESHGRDFSQTRRWEDVRAGFVGAGIGNRWGWRHEPVYYHNSGISFFFGVGPAFYPYYAPVYDPGAVYFSLYGYFGSCPPYVYRSHCFWAPPVVTFIDVPIYSGDECRGYRPAPYSAYEPGQNPDLDNAIDDIRTAFQTGNVDSLVNVTDPNVRIAVFLRGKYDYSMGAGDYLDLTRDALHTTETISFDLYQIHPRSAGVWVASGRHVYRDKDGQPRTMYVSFVLERINGKLTITQVGTAPDRIREP